MTNFKTYFIKSLSISQIKNIILFICSSLILISCVNQPYSQSGQYSRPDRPNIINQPTWAPVYANSNNVEYYYFPDYQIYYDVWSQEFAFLENGQWYFSPVLPAYYAGIDLNYAYLVALNSNVYQPWLHHDMYVSHYPKYFYRTRPNMGYDHDVRGYNENGNGLFQGGRNGGDHDNHRNNGGYGNYGNNSSYGNNGSYGNNAGNDNNGRYGNRGSNQNNGNYNNGNANNGNANNGNVNNGNANNGNVNNGNVNNGNVNNGTVNNGTYNNNSNNENGRGNNGGFQNNNGGFQNTGKGANAGMPINSGRSPQDVQYNTPQVGRPVDVQPHMRPPSDPQFRPRSGGNWGRQN